MCCKVLEALQCEDLARLLIALARFVKTTTGSISSVLEVLGESKLELGSSPGGSFGGSSPGTPSTPGGFWVGVCTEQGGEWKLVVEDQCVLPELKIQCELWRQRQRQPVVDGWRSYRIDQQTQDCASCFQKD